MARRGKKKKRKVKYLSLSRHLTKAAVDAPELAAAAEENVHQQQVEVFALHPEASTLFAAAPSLTDILGASSSSGCGGGESSCLTSSPGGRFAGEEEDLARRALRGRERWVYYGTPTTTTTSSSSCSSSAQSPPLLKLDYDEVLAAWAGRGPLYISTGAVAVMAVHATPKLELESVSVSRVEKVRRYKEKRESRLFSNRIRYEVRRINAVRRPRFKGRFVKENEDAAVCHEE